MSCQPFIDRFYDSSVEELFNCIKAQLLTGSGTIAKHSILPLPFVTAGFCY